VKSENLPRLESLGDDLLKTTPWQRWQPFAMPYLYAGAFIVAWQERWFCWSAAFLVLVFSATSTSTHDVLHGSLGLGRKITEISLFFLGAPILESGHAYRLTHLHHHTVFPREDDLEGAAAYMPMWKVLLLGPTFLPRLWLWAYRKTENQPGQRRWLIFEALLPFAGLAVGLLLLPTVPGVLAYVLAVLLSSWFYPLFAVHLPHRGFGNQCWNQAWTLRGRLIPRLFRPLAFHLEHHLYPRVPSHNLAKLAERLEPSLRERNVRQIHVP
jgi:beta-carotene hydroxylase